MKSISVRSSVMGCVALLACFAGSAFAQDYPNRPVRLFLPYNPGGIVDYVGRVLAQHLGKDLGQTVVAENRPGAGSMVATATLAKSVPDGYTIQLGDPAIVINRLLHSNAQYDLFKELQTVSIISSSPGVLIVTPGLPVKTFSELVAYGKANPGALDFASAGIGTPMHLAGEMFKLGTGIDAIHIPYKGIGASYADLMTGKVKMAFSSIAGALPYTGDNRVRALATTGRGRSSAYPNLPTIVEAGVPDYEVDLWLGIFAPAPLPVEIAARLNAALKKVLQTREIEEAFAKAGVLPRGTTAEDGAAFVRAEYAKWRKVITDGKIKVD